MNRVEYQLSHLKDRLDFESLIHQKEILLLLRGWLAGRLSLAWHVLFLLIPPTTTIEPKCSQPTHAGAYYRVTPRVIVLRHFRFGQAAKKMHSFGCGIPYCLNVSI